MLSLRREFADRHVFDHAPPQWAHGLVGHGDAPVLSEVVETPRSQDRTPRGAIVLAVPPAAVPYRASGLVRWRKAVVDARTLAFFGCGWPRVSTVRRFVNLLRRNGLVLLRRQCKLKYCPPWLICTGPQPATVRLDDRPADRQTHAQAGRLGGIESLENAVRTCGVQAWARVSNGNEDLARI